MKGFALVFAAILLFPASLCGVSLENGILKVEVDDDSGRIFLAAVGSGAGFAGPAAAAEGGRQAAGLARPLLFQDTPPSSYTVVSIAGGASVFGSTEGRFVEEPRAKEGEIVCVWETDWLRTTQIVSFIERSGVQEGVLVRYVLKNTDGRESPAGICVVLDTVLSEDSGAHFLLSDGRSVEGFLELSGKDMPDFWATGAQGSACLMGALRGSTATPPERALFANYRDIRERLAPTSLGSSAVKREGFTYGAFSRNDSAVALVFSPAPLAAEREYRIVIGVCGEGEFGTTKPARESAPAAREEEPPAGAPTPPPPPPSVAGYLAPPAAAAPGTGARAGPMPDPLDTIDDLIEEIDRLVEQLHLRMRGARAPAELPPPTPGEEELRALNERLEEIEGKGGEVD